MHSDKWLCMYMLGVIARGPCNPSVREQKRSSESAIVISVPVSSCRDISKNVSRIQLRFIKQIMQTRQKNKIQFFHSSAVKEPLESIWVGIRPRFGGRITFSIRSWITSIVCLSRWPCLIYTSWIMCLAVPRKTVHRINQQHFYRIKVSFNKVE